MEESMYYQIVNQRMDIIEKFENLTNEHHKEKILQEYLYKNLWLLDPAWERPTSSEGMENSLGKLFGDEVKLSEDEKKARLDIRFKQFAGKTVVVELKKYERIISLGEAVQQVSKYSKAIKKALRKIEPEREPVYEIILLLGKYIDNDASLESLEQVKETLKPSNARILYYDELINNARNAYKEYFLAKRSMNSIIEIFNEIDD